MVKLAHANLQDETVRRLRSDGLVERDIATLLGISHQRVHQVIESSSE